MARRPAGRAVEKIGFEHIRVSDVGDRGDELDLAGEILTANDNFLERDLDIGSASLQRHAACTELR